MSKMIVQHRRGSTDAWLNTTHIPLEGELVLEETATEGVKIKVGDGIHKFVELPYITQFLEQGVSNNIKDVSENIQELASRVDELVAPTESTLTLDAELRDIRVSTSGQRYQTAGAAVRAIEDNLDSLRAELPSFIPENSVDGLAYEGNQLYLTSQGNQVGEAITITGGGGGGGTSSSTVISLRNSGSTTSKMVVAAGEPVNLSFTFTSTEDGIPTGDDNICEIWVNSKIEKTIELAQGEHNINIVEYLKKGTNKVQLVCYDYSGASKKLAYTINIIELKIEPENFNEYQIFRDKFEFNYLTKGQVAKVAHFIIDGKPLEDEFGDPIIQPINSGEKHASITLPKLSHGCHTLKVYLTAEVDGKNIISNELYYELLFDDINSGNRRHAMISSVYQTTEITNGDLVSIPYYLYDPWKTPCTIKKIIYELNDDNSVKSEFSSSEDVADRKIQTWDTRTYPKNRAKFVLSYTYQNYDNDGNLVDYTITKEHIVTIKALDLDEDLEALDTGLQLYLSAAGRSNNEINPGIWQYTQKVFEGGSYIDKETITTSFNNFNWVGNGWVTDYEGDQCLRLNGDARAVINFKPFEIINNSSGENINDLLKTGKTFEFEFALRDVNSREAVVIDCMSEDNIGFRAMTDKAFLQSKGTLIKCNYKDNERIRVSITVQPLVEAKVYDKDKNLIKYTYGFTSIYVNGTLSGCQLYSDTDSFSQSKAVNITLGSNLCGLDIYSMRVYSTALSIPEVLNNYISDTNEPARKIELYKANNLLDADTKDISYEKVKAWGKIPIITFTGPMPTYKGDKKKKMVRMKFEHPDYPELNFDVLLDEIDVQGTSSQWYVRKNWKVKLPEPKIHIPGYIPAKVFCIKVDYAEATGTHNTGVAMYAESLYDRDVSTFPAQEDDERVRTTIAGYPVVLFEKATEDSEPVFASKGNFNYDKGSEDAFGFTEDYDVECWEFKNNTSDSVNFLSTIPVAWESDFEPRYISKAANYDRIEDLLKIKENAAQGGQGLTDLEAMELEDLMTACIANLQEVVSWVNSTATYTIESGERVEITPKSLANPVVYNNVTYEEDNKAYRLAKFKNEFTKYFDLHYATVYYVFTFVALMTDQRAKNMFLTRWKQKDGSYKWYPYFYDNDTIFGINNEGALVFDYYHEDTDKLGSSNIYNGQNSVLWNNFRECFGKEIKDLYTILRSADSNGKSKLSYESIIEQFVSNGSDKWPAVIYNEDADYKYISMAKPNDEGVVDTANLYQVRGPGDSHLKYFIDNRLNYCDSKWFAGDYPQDYIFLRIYTPVVSEDTTNMSDEERAENAKIAASLRAVPANASITVEPYSAMYAGVRYKANGILQQERLSAGEEFTFLAPTQEDGTYENFNDTETAIYGASELSSLKDLSGLYCGVINLSKAQKLVNIKIGDSHEDYYNSNFREISVGANRLLKTIDLTNCSGLGIASGKNESNDIVAPQKTLDLSNCPNIENIYTKGTHLEAISLPDGGYIKKLHLPNSISTINIKNQLYIEELVLDDYSNLKVLCLDNCPTLDPISMLSKCKDVNGNWTLERLRLTNIDWQLETPELLFDLMSLKGRSSTDAEVDHAFLSGKVHISNITGEQYTQLFNYYNKFFNNNNQLIISYDDMISYISFYHNRVDENGDAIPITIVKDGVDTGIPWVQEIRGSSSQSRHTVDPVLEGYIFDGEKLFMKEPIQDKTIQYSFKYCGWTQTMNGNLESDALQNITGDRKVYPAFNKEINKYKVQFYNEDTYGPNLLVEVEAEYGSVVKYPGESDPIKANTNKPDSYTFIGWYPEPKVLPKSFDEVLKTYAQFSLKADKWFPASINEFNYIIDNISGEDILRITYYDWSQIEPIVLVPATLDVADSNGTTNYKVHSVEGFGGTAVEHVKLSEGIKEITRISKNYNLINTWGAFQNCTRLQAVELPESLEKIQQNAFIDCPILTSIHIPKNVNSISEYFAGGASSGLLNISVDSENLKFKVVDNCLLELLGSDDYKVLVGAQNCKIPSNMAISRIGAHAIRRTNIENVELPESVKTIGEFAFASCPNLKTVKLPDNCKLDTGSFAWSPNLAEINLPANITDIPNHLLNKTAIESLEIPATVKNIYSFAFAECSNLKRLKFYGKPLYIYNEAIEHGILYNAGHPDGLLIEVPWNSTDIIDSTSQVVTEAPWGAGKYKVNNTFKQVIPVTIRYADGVEDYYPVED